jgi:hypothetical protein
MDHRVLWPLAAGALDHVITAAGHRAPLVRFASRRRLCGKRLDIHACRARERPDNGGVGQRGDFLAKLFANHKGPELGGDEPVSIAMDIGQASHGSQPVMSSYFAMRYDTIHATTRSGWLRSSQSGQQKKPGVDKCASTVRSWSTENDDTDTSGYGSGTVWLFRSLD